MPLIGDLSAEELARINLRVLERKLGEVQTKTEIAEAMANLRRHHAYMASLARSASNEGVTAPKEPSPYEKTDDLVLLALRQRDYEAGASPEQLATIAGATALEDDKAPVESAKEITAGRRQKASVNRVTAFRWVVFRAVSALGWWICPEPYKSGLIAAMPAWDEIGRGQQHRRVSALAGVSVDGAILPPPAGSTIDRSPSPFWKTTDHSLPNGEQRQQ